MNMGGVSFHRPRPASRLIHAEGYAASLMPPIHNFGLYLQGQSSGGSAGTAFFVITVFSSQTDENTVSQRVSLKN